MITLIVVLIVLLLLGYIVQSLLPGPVVLKNILLVVLALVAIFYVLDAFGVINAPQLRRP